MTIDKAISEETYNVISVSGNEKIQKFLKTLGLYEGSQITLISKVGTNYILNVKDSRYAIDTVLASHIEIKKSPKGGI